MSTRHTTDANGNDVKVTDRADIAMPGERGTYVEAEDDKGNKAYGSDDDDAISNLPDD